MKAPVELKITDWLATADFVEEEFASHKMPIEPASDLRFMVDELRWAAAFDDFFSRAVAVDEIRAVRAFRLLRQMKRIAGALEKTREIVGVRDKLQHLRRNSINAVSLRVGPGFSILFELEVAGKLCMNRWKVSFSEPDIILKHEAFGQVGLACKQPTKDNSIGRNIRKASQQIQQSGRPGYIIISLDGFAPTILGRFETQWQARDIADRYACQALNANVCEIADALDQGTWGVAICVNVLAVVQKPSSVCWDLGIARIANLELPGADVGLDGICEMLGDRDLISQRDRLPSERYDFTSNAFTNSN